MKAAASDGVPHHKSEGAAPVTKTKGGASRNIVRKGAPAVERKAGAAGGALAYPSMDGALPVDPGDPNYESPNDPDRVSNDV